MKKLILLLFVISFSANAQVLFDDYFLNKTLRIDFYHTGAAEKEIISFDELIEEPFWGGSKINLVDTFFFGNYYLNVNDLKTGKLIYSRGFSTLFQEWQTTDEAKTVEKTLNGSAVIPFPKDSIEFSILRRDKENVFQEKFTMKIYPDNYFIKKENRHKTESFKVHYSGEPNEKLDIVFIAEGYSADEQRKFRKDCQDYAATLFKYSPFKENEEKINVWGVAAVSEDSGADIPADSIWKKTALNSSYYTFDSERYLMVTDYQTLRDYAANVPYDQIYILVNSDKYGGGAIYNFYSLGITGNKKAERVFIHEFGHGLAGLADEYVDLGTYNEYYNLNVEPWEANITTLVNFEKKWKKFVDEETPVPTPDEEKYYDKLGAFEGAGYVPEGVYRPTHNSIMRALNTDKFNLPSLKALEAIINFYAE